MVAEAFVEIHQDLISVPVPGKTSALFSLFLRKPSSKENMLKIYADSLFLIKGNLFCVKLGFPVIIIEGSIESKFFRSNIK